MVRPGGFHPPNASSILARVTKREIESEVGGAVEVLADTEWQVSFLAGYAGTDFIENLYKIKLGQKFSNLKIN